MLDWQASMPDESNRSPTWPRWQRLWFRFGAIYLSLYCLCYLGYHSARTVFRPLLDHTWTPLMRAVVPRVGALLLGRPITVFPNGSLDTTYNWGEALMLMGIAGVGAAVWSVRTRQAAHPVLWDRLQILLRYFLAGAMLRYGTIKLFGAQFRDLGAEQLLTPRGEMSPMGLLWSLMTSSPI
jgi:hypothetical protein